MFIYIMCIIYIHVMFTCHVCILQGQHLPKMHFVALGTPAARSPEFTSHLFPLAT